VKRRRLSDAAEDTDCEHCHWPLWKHVRVDDFVLCKLSANYTCKCGRW
jgi:hypothetical protein